MKLIDKNKLLEELKKLKQNLYASPIVVIEDVESLVESLVVQEQEVNLEKESLTWEDIRELYIIFAEVDVDIELCKTANIQAETIGYYQEVLKRFKAQKGE